MERGGDLDLAEEPLAADCGGDVVVEHLDGHPAVVLVVAREVHRRHPAPADRLENLVWPEPRARLEPLLRYP